MANSSQDLGAWAEIGEPVGNQRHEEKALQAEDAANRELTRRILEAAPGGIVHVSSGGAMLSANSEALRILGMSFDELSRQYVADFETETIWEDGSPCPPSAYPVTQALITGEPQPRATIGIRRPDGDISWAVFTAVPVKDLDGVTTGAVATFLDITERKNLEEAQTRSEATLHSVVQSAPSLIFSVDRDATILFANRSPFSDAPPETLVGKDLYEVLADLGAARLREAVASVLANGTAVGFEVQTAGSLPSRFAVRVGPVKRGQEVEGVTLVASDVTEIGKLQSQLIVSERLAALGTLAAGVAHEINNPLTYVLLKLEALVARAESGKSGARDADELRAVAEGAQRIARIVHDLGTVSRLGSVESESVSLASVLNTAIEMVRVETKDRAKVVRDFAEDSNVAGDEARLVQVFINLLINAAHAIEEGEANKNQIRIATRPSSHGRVCIEVEDTGRGIAVDDIERIFEPFFTTKGPNEGTGLGLHVCHQIIGSLGGEISVRSELGRGSCFSIVLTVARISVEETIADEDAKSSGAQALRILVIDDELLIRRTFETLLQEHAVECAGSGREGIERLREGEYDVIFCDVSMPDLTGMDVYEFLRSEQRGRETSLVFITGGAFKQRTVDFLEQVPNRVLRKPFLLEEIERCLPGQDRRIMR